MFIGTVSQGNTSLKIACSVIFFPFRFFVFLVKISVNVFLFVQKLPIRVCCVTLPKISDFSHEICKFRRAAQRKVSSFSLIFSLSSDWLSFLAHGWRSHSWGFGGTRMAITHSRTLSPTSPPENRFCPQGILPLFLTNFRGVLERRKFWPVYSWR